MSSMYHLNYQFYRYKQESAIFRYSKLIQYIGFSGIMLLKSLLDRALIDLQKIS